jgi:CheY-like chemotaxis protein
MPGLNGFDCLHAMRARGTTSPVVILTADLDTYDLESEAHGLDALIQSKLCSLEEIKALVEYLSDSLSPGVVGNIVVEPERAAHTDK